jgi:hypothetical protein
MSYKPEGIWLEIEEIEYDSNYRGSREAEAAIAAAVAKAAKAAKAATAKDAEDIAKSDATAAEKKAAEAVATLAAATAESAEEAAKAESAIVARFKADQDPGESTWYKVAHIGSNDASGEYDRFLKWLDKGRILLGRLGIIDGNLCIAAIRTKTPKLQE